MKMNYIELKNKQQEKITELSKKVGLFWAFSNEQFNEGKKQNPSPKYTSIGMGGYLPSGNVDEYIKGMKELDKWMKEERKKLKREKVILYELNNYECFYSGDITDAWEVLKDTYTREEVEAVYRSHKRHDRCAY